MQSYLCCWIFSFRENLLICSLGLSFYMVTAIFSFVPFVHHQLAGAWSFCTFLKRVWLQGKQTEGHLSRVKVVMATLKWRYFYHLCRMPRLEFKGFPSLHQCCSVISKAFVLIEVGKGININIFIDKTRHLEIEKYICLNKAPVFHKHAVVNER